MTRSDSMRAENMGGPDLARLAEEARPKSVLEDPSATAIARTYADAFLQAAAHAPEGADAVLGELTELHDDLLEPNPDFARLLTGPLVGEDEKLGLIDRAVAPHASPLLANFLRVLARHGRLDLLPRILGEAHVARERELGKRRVTVTTAVPLSDGELADLERELGAAVSFTPVLIPEVDPAILGGLVIRVGDTVYDSSLKARLRQLRGRLQSQATHEIQSRRDRFRDSEGDRGL